MKSLLRCFSLGLLLLAPIAPAWAQAPTVSPISDVSMTAGTTRTVNVVATGHPDSTVTLTSSLPAFATLNAPTSGTGGVTTTISLAPAAADVGTHTASVTATSGTLSSTASFQIIVTAVPTPAAQVTLIGRFKSEHERTCFRIRPLDHSFDVRNVSLASIEVRFNGQSVTALAGRTRLQLDCDDEGEEGEHEGDHDGESDSTGHHDDAARFLRDGGFPGDHGEGDDDDDCEECEHDCDTCHVETCDAVGIRACFATDALVALFGEANLPASLHQGDVRFTLTDGTIVIAPIGGSGLREHGRERLHVKAMPNPLNPRTELSFTLTRPGRVQVGVYDLQGRLVNRIFDGNLSSGPQKVTWDGSNGHNDRVSSGVYFFRIQAPGAEAIQRVAVVK